MRRIPCYLEIDKQTYSATIVGRHGERLLQIKFEASTFHTMTRVEPGYDADNYWLGIKPSDRAVFENKLFGNKKLKITDIQWELC
jgi:hypothetical protein